MAGITAETSSFSKLKTDKEKPRRRKNYVYIYLFICNITYISTVILKPILQNLLSYNLNSMIFYDMKID